MRVYCGRCVKNTQHVTHQKQSGNAKPAVGCHLLLAQFRNGDQEAFDRLFVEKQVSLLRFVKKDTHPLLDDMEVEAIVQQAFLKIYMKIATYRGNTDGEAWGWINTIARNNWKDALRQKKRYDQRLVSLNDELSTGQEESRQAFDQPDWLESIVSTLTEREKQVLELLQDGVSQTQIASQLGLCLPRITQIKQSIKKKVQKNIK